MLLVVPLISTLAYGAGNEKELRNVFDTYNKYAQADNMKKMLSMLTSAMKEEITSQIKNREDRDYFVLVSKGQVPSSYEVQHITLSKDGNRADMYMLMHLPAMKEIDRKKTDMEAMVSFEKEKGTWKMEGITPLGDPSQIKRPKDLTYNKNDADDGQYGSVAGRIVKLEFKSNHTLIILRVIDEEIAVFLPPKKTLEGADVNLDDLAPWKMREFTGFPHKTDKLRFFATGDRPME